MKLTTVFFKHGGKNVKAIVPVDKIDFFISLGASKEPVEELTTVEVPPVPPTPAGPGFMGDRGAGAPGSIEWHENHIMNLRTKAEVNNYLEEVVGKKLPARFKLDELKKGAIEILRNVK